MFAFETKEVINSNRFQDHAPHLLNKLDSIEENLKNLVTQSDKFEILIQVYLQFDKDQYHFGFSAESELLKKLAEYCHQIEWRNK